MKTDDLLAHCVYSSRYDIIYFFQILVLTAVTLNTIVCTLERYFFNASICSQVTVWQRLFRMDVLWAFYCRRKLWKDIQALHGLPDLLCWCSAHSLYISHWINVVHWFRWGGPVHTYYKWGLPLKEVYISICPLLGWKVRWNLRREIGSFVLSHSPQNNCETDLRHAQQ